MDGGGGRPAQETADEVRTAGGRAVASLSPPGEEHAG